MANTKKNLHVKTGDRVIVTAGKDKGKVSSVKKVITSENKVVVEALAISSSLTDINDCDY